MFLRWGIDSRVYSNGFDTPTPSPSWCPPTILHPDMSATTTRVKPLKHGRRATESKGQKKQEGKKRKGQRAKEKFPIIAWESEDGSVIRVDTVEKHWVEADPILGTRRAESLKINMDHRYLHKLINLFFTFFSFTLCPEFLESHTATPVIGLAGKSIIPSEIMQLQLKAL